MQDMFTATVEPTHVRYVETTINGTSTVYKQDHQWKKYTNLYNKVK